MAQLYFRIITVTSFNVFRFDLIHLLETNNLSQHTQSVKCSVHKNIFRLLIDNFGTDFDLSQVGQLPEKTKFIAAALEILHRYFPSNRISLDEATATIDLLN